MAHKKWIIRDADKERASALSEKFNIDPMVAFLIVSRGITDDLTISNFLADSFEIVDPFRFADMDVAAFTIGDAIDNQEKICIYGDYDCDGVTATALLYSFFKSQGADVCYYIPSRDGEGYGLNLSAIDTIKSMGVSLIVTVDNGISAIEEAEYIYQQGMRLVVTDHHQLIENLPRAEAVVNPHRTDNDLEFNDYAGVGVAFKLACAMYEGDVEDLIKDYIDLVAIGTIADVVPLVAENRAFVKRGLSKINNNPRTAIKAFVDSNGTKKEYGATDIAFQLCPRINAAGRLDDATKAVEFLVSDSMDDAVFKCEQLNIENSHRQEIEKNIVDDIDEQILANPSLVNDRVIVIDGKNYHHGVIGIVAAHILERYGKPTIIIGVDDDSVARGSARSVDGFNIFEAISSCADDLIQFGGHPLAAGLSLDKDKIDLFRKHINEYAYKNYSVMPPQTITLDCKISPFYLNLDLVSSLEVLEPYGCSNPQAIFGLYNLKLINITPLSEGKHIRLDLEKKGKVIRVVKFNEPFEQFAYKQGQMLNLAVKISKNFYKDKYYLSVQALDIRLATTDDDKYFSEKSAFELFENKGVANISLYPDRNVCADFYRYLKLNNGYRYSFDNLYFELQSVVTYGQLKYALIAFEQAGLISTDKGIIINNVNNKVNLEDTQILKSLRGRLNVD